MIKFLTEKKNQKGFTLLEAVVATTIVMVGIVGVLIVSQDAVLIVYDARDKLTAAYFAKEGAEIVRNIRDENWLRGKAWSTGLAPGTYEAQYNSENLTDWGGSLEYLRTDPTTRIFSYEVVTGDKVTIFTRKITIDSLAPDDGIKVRVDVSWRDYIFSLEENLYNWR